MGLAIDKYICHYTCVAQLAIYLHDTLARKLDRAAQKAGVSRSRLVANLLERHFDDRLPDEFFQVLGAWEDDRSVEDIVADIRSAGRDSTRATLE